MLLAPDFDTYCPRGESSIYFSSWRLSGLMAVCHKFIFTHCLKTAPKSFILCKSCLSLTTSKEIGTTKDIWFEMHTKMMQTYLCTATEYIKLI